MEIVTKCVCLIIPIPETS